MVMMMMMNWGQKSKCQEKSLTQRHFVHSKYESFMES
jgi:hypothetical protein